MINFTEGQKQALVEKMNAKSQDELRKIVSYSQQWVTKTEAGEFAWTGREIDCVYYLMALSRINK